MSDLISRSELLDAFNNKNIQITFDLPVEEVLGEDVDLDDFAMLVQDAIQAYKKMVIDTIKNQPTAYDVDKVAGELKKHKDTTDLTTVDEEMVVGFTIYQGAFNDAIDKAIEIVKQEAERCNSGWILCSERFPDECVPVNVTWINRNPESYYAKIKDVPFSATAVYYNSKWYWYSSTCIDYLTEYGKNDFDLVDKDIDIIAWMELPSAYIPKEK